MKRLIAWLALILLLVIWAMACEVSLAPYRCISVAPDSLADTTVVLECR